MPDESQKAPGRRIEVQGGEADGTTFFVGDVVIRADGFDAITSRPMDLGDGIPKVFGFLTFIGTDNETFQPRAVTLIVRTEALLPLSKAAKQLFQNIPLVFRESPSVDDDPRGAIIPEVPGTVAEG